MGSRCEVAAQHLPSSPTSPAARPARRHEGRVQVRHRRGRARLLPFAGRGDRREAAIAKRLDRLTHQFDRLERDQTILIETVALFVRYTLTVNAPIPAAHQDAARAQGLARFEQFVDQLARHLQKGRSLVKDVHEEIFPDESRFFASSDDGRDEATAGRDGAAIPA